MLGKIKERVMNILKMAKKIGEDDPRRIFHSIKVGLALTIVSLLYYFRPLYDGFGQAGMWAILTVVVVFEFSVGGTISKCLNRGGATLVAGALGVGAEHLATLCADKGEPFILGFLVFILAAVSTFTRFIPSVKRRYDYGMLIFILTFTLVAVSGARVTELLELAHQRLSTILIGSATCIIISFCICPVWAGLDLHNLLSANIAKLAASLEAFGGEFCISPGDLASSSKDGKDKSSCLQSYKSVLNSKATEELLANFAWWEPCHGRFKLNHPWSLYLNVGCLVRQCACLIETLNGSIKSQSQVMSEFQQKIEPACAKMSIECGKALREISTALRNMRVPSSSSDTVMIHLNNSKAAVHELKTIMENFSLPSQTDLNEIVPVLVVASILIDIIKSVEEISTSVTQLCEKAGFKEVKSHLLHGGTVNPLDGEAVVVEIVEIKETSNINNVATI